MGRAAIPHPAPTAEGEGSCGQRARRYFLLRLPGWMAYDLGVLCERHEQRPCEVAIVLGEAEGEASGVFQRLLAEAGTVGGALGERLHGLQQVRLAEGDESLSGCHGRNIPGASST